MGEPEDGLAASAEAIATLSRPFVDLPQAFASHMRDAVKEYFDRCKKLGREPDMAMLEPIVAIFSALNSKQEDHT